MRCRVCSSVSEVEFTAEMMIHFSGRTHLDNPGVLTFSELLVCLECGSTRFTMSETELRLLREGTPPLRSVDYSAARLRKAI